MMDTFSPVRNPATRNNVKSPPADQNIPRITVLMRKIVENFDAWRIGEETGRKICRNIGLIKTKLLEKKEKLISTRSDGTQDDALLISEDLVLVHKRLQVVISVFEEIVKHSEEIQRQLGALKQLQQNNNDTILFKTWNLSGFLEAHEYILQQYREDFRLKSVICREIGHCINQAQLISLTILWSSPRFFSKTLKFAIKCISTECNFEVVV